MIINICSDKNHAKKLIVLKMAQPYNWPYNANIINQQYLVLIYGDTAQ